MKNCLDIIRPFAADLAERGYNNVQFFGGIGSYALTLPTTEIHQDDKLVTVSEDVMLPQYRDDGNLRDLDGLVKSTNPLVVAEVEQLARETIDDNELILSFFGFRPIQQLEHQSRHPILSSMKVFVSDRYVTETEGQVGMAKKALFPFAVDLDPAALETWQLEINGDDPLPIPHPGATILNYMTRSISGLRPKDDRKLNELTINVTTKAPETMDWIYDGPGSSQLVFARILQSIRSPAAEKQSVEVGGRIKIVPYNLDELTHHYALMVHDDSIRSSLMVKVASMKSQLVHFYEEHDKAVTWFQKNIEPRIGKFLKNEA